MGTPTTSFTFGSALYSGVAKTSGPLVTGRYYMIGNIVAGDSFTSSGAASNTNGTRFLANGTAPSWSNGSTLREEIRSQYNPGDTGDTAIDAPPLYGTFWHFLSPTTTYYWAAWLVNGSGQQIFFGPKGGNSEWEYYKFTTVAF